MSVIDWLLDGDPAIRWQVLRDLGNASPDDVAAERARVEHDGWGARLLALGGPDGLWEGGACFPASYTGGEPGQPWTPTMHTLQTLQLFGLDPASESARRAIALVAENGRWEHAGQRYFDGEVEPCINGRTTAAGTARSRTVPCAPPSTPRSTCSMGCWSSSERPAGPRRCARPGAAVRSTCSSAACSAARAPARSSTRHISSSRSPTTGATTCCARSTTSAGRARTRIPGWRRPWRSCDPSGSPTAGGCSTASTRVASTSTSRAAWGRRAAGTPSARSVCSTGGTAPPDASAAEDERIAHLAHRRRTDRRPPAPTVVMWSRSGPDPL